MLAATDPAQPYGAALPWPKRDDEPTRGARSASPAPTSCSPAPSRSLYVERGGKGLLDARRGRRPARCARRSRRSPTSSAPAACGGSRSSASTASRSSARRWTPLLIELGFRQGPRALTLSASGRMPEGDTIHYAANRMRPVLEGRVPDEIVTPQPRHATRPLARAARRAARSSAVDAHGKHLFLRFEGDLVIHSHLRMTGAWGDLPSGPALAAARRGARGSCCARRDHEVVQFDGPVLELMTESRTRFDRRLAGARARHPRPTSSTSARFLRRLREDDPTRPIGDALLDQRTIAGIGNLWKAEGCCDAGDRPVAARPARSPTTRRCAIVRADAPADAAVGRATGYQTRDHRRLRPRRRARARAAARRSARAGRATTTARPTGARDASADRRRGSATRAPT